MSQPIGLRERKKEATTERLNEVALDLFAEHGFDAVSIDDIAAAADVSKTTFYRYFESKEDVLLGRAGEHLELLETALAERPEGESAVDAARHAFRHVAVTYQADREQKLIVSRLTRTTPSLASRNLAHQAQWEEVMREETARRHPELDQLKAWVLAAQIIAATRAATAYWLSDGAQGELPDLVDDALRPLRPAPPA